MKTLPLGLWLSLCVHGGSATATAPREILDLAEQCREDTREECQLLYVQAGRVMFRPANASHAREMGAYLTELSAVVPRVDAPVLALALPGGGQVVVAWGFQKSFRAFGPVFRLYFLDATRRILRRETGDVIIRFLKAGPVFGTGSNFVAVSMQSESAIAIVSRIWRWDGRSAPVLVFDESGVIDRIESQPAPGVWITSASVADGRRSQWQTGFRSWDEGSGRFTRRSAPE